MIGPLTWSLAQIALSSAEMPPDPYFPPALATTPLSCRDNGRPMPILSDFENGWFSKHLRAAQEPSLYVAARKPPSGDDFILRFTWLRTFHAPVVIRVEPVPGGGFRLAARQLSGAGGYDPGKIAKRVDRAMTAAEVQGLRGVMARNAIFDQAPANCELGMDGSEWIIEGVDRAGYRFFKRWSPDDGAIRAVGLHLIGLSGWSFKDVY
ncbi:hypothetical protein [Sphingomonas sp. G-3-2-10]|uniref:hypothetical protein n=1 Tax=Sphingomonas sp. G-3-2-10 TaxID=2728838 RepID=UPI00146AC7F6|nr:hypothetical protein [Sphingomonas sp. G-3-2-10]NML07780.1 hypothetical protein [Sphingomonas sp. G-3-2-10]